MATQLLSLNWRTWLASIIGLVTPYWFLSLWFIYLRDFTPLVGHFALLGSFMPPSYTAGLNVEQLLIFVFTLILTVMGIWHFWSRSFEDKIRIRLLYGLFTTLALLSLTFTIMQPQLFDPLMRIVFVCASPLIAHYMSLTGSRLTNIVFMVATALALAITAVNLYLPAMP